MVVVTGAVGEEIIIDGRIRIRILAIHGEEVYLEVNYPECVQADDDEVDGQDPFSRWSAGNLRPPKWS
jgi:sRNA-binding carbon storage regulator CsrA